MKSPGSSLPISACPTMRRRAGPPTSHEQMARIPPPRALSQACGSGSEPHNTCYCEEMTMDKKSLRRHWQSWPFVGMLAALLFLFTAAFIYFGIYNLAADSPHTKPVYALLDS